MARSGNGRDSAYRDKFSRNNGHGGPQKMADVLSALMSRRGYAQLHNTAQYQEAWQEAIDQKFAEHTRAGNLKRGVLEVFVRNSAVLQELSFQKKQLLKKLAEQSGEHEINDLRFRVGGID